MQYDLMEKTTQVNPSALLLILEKIKNNTEVEAKPPSTIKPIKAEDKCKMESVDFHILKKPKQVGFSDKQCTLCKKTWQAVQSTILMTVASLIRMVLQSKGMGAQEAHKGMDTQTRTIQS